MERLLVVRLGSLGDLVHTLPAVAAIRRSAPSLEIDWLVDAVHREFLGLVPILTGIVTLADRTAAAWLRTRRDLKARRYDTAVDFQGLIKSAAFARLSGARRVLGFDRSALRERAASLFYTEAVPIGAGQHVIDKNLRLAAAVGAAAGPLEFPIGDVRSECIAEFVAAQPAPLALVNPGAAWPNKRWPADRLAELCRVLHERHRLTPVVLWGPGEERLARSVASTSNDVATVAPPTGLRDFVALARSARLIVSGDTGPLHIAAALGVPVVALFGPTDPQRNGPWDSADINLSRYERCDCHYERKCRHDAARWCLGTIDVSQVLAAVEIPAPSCESRSVCGTQAGAMIPATGITSVLARFRVPLGFAFAALAFWLARPSRSSLLIGLAVALAGEALRIWAAGHLEKGREVTRSGPYRFVRHPLYLGSSLMALGFVVAARSVPVAAVAAIYLGTTVVAAMRTEEATLDERFVGEYAAYREGRAAPSDRPFSVARVLANREPRTLLGLAIAWGLLVLALLGVD